MINRKIPWTTQPQIPVQVDWSNPLNKDCFGVYSRGLLHTQQGILSPVYKSTGALKTTQFGTGSTFDGSANSVELFNLGRTTAGDKPFSIEFLVVGSSFPHVSCLFSLSPLSNTTGAVPESSAAMRSVISASGNIYAWGGNFDYASGIPFELNKLQHIIVTLAGGTGQRQYTVYRNGAQISQGLSSGSTLNASGPYLYVGGNWAGNNAITGSIIFGTASERLISAAEVRERFNNPWQIFKSQSRRIFVASAGGDVTLPLGFVTETDSANSITAAKSRATGQASESDSAIGIGASKSVTLGLTVETNQAQAIALAKSAGLGITTEADTNFALSRSKLATIGQPAEADSANAVARSKTVTLGIVIEADSAPSLGAGVSVAIDQVVEADTAQAIIKAKSKALSQVVESDSVPPIAATKTLALGLVTEIDTPLALAQASGITLGHVTESDAAPAISVTKVKVLGQVTEANTVAGIAKAKSATIGQVVEADTANPLVGNLVAVLGLVTEVEFAHSISLLKSRGLLQVTEADSVLGLTKDKVVYISQVVEVDQVFSVFSKIDYRFVESSYNTLSIDPAYNKMYIDPNYH